MNSAVEFGEELDALGSVLEALQPLDSEKRRFVILSAIQKFGIGVEGAAALGTPRSTGLSEGSPPSGALDSAETVKSFLKRKHPVTDVQRVACLAYYLAHNRKVLAFKTLDLMQLNTEAAGEPFSKATFTVENATKQNHFLSPAGQGRKQITGLGEDVVDALPEQEKIKTVIAAATAGRRKRRTRKGKNKKS